jgi:predicted MFS family arabinose efflux permease
MGGLARRLLVGGRADAVARHADSRGLTEEPAGTEALLAGLDPLHGISDPPSAVLREATLLSAILFCAFSAFWTTLVFFLQTPPYHYGSGVAGLFGLVGAAGAIGAPFVGRAADRYGARRNVLISLLVTLISFVVLYMFGTHIGGLIAGVVLLDVGVQSGHVSNQTRIYGLLPEARSRLNMVYMICFFTAGAIGSYAGTMMWQRFAWGGVCGLGGVLLLAGCVVYFSTGETAKAN